MITPDTTHLIDILGGEDVTRFVGGCVRNYLLGLPADDIDFATKLYPQEVIKRLTAAGIKVVPTGIDHGTVTAVLGGKGYEITTLRRDVATDGRRAVVAYTESWLEDAMRRDFTMNTLSAGLAGDVFDPLGRGVDDLYRGRVVFVGDPEERIHEDYLRILRFFRFHARFGKGRPDAKALAACEVASPKIKALSKERVTHEFLKILSVPKSPQTLTLMLKSRVLSDVVSSKYQETHLKYLINKQKNIFLPSRLLAAAGLSEAGIRRMEAHLRLPLKTLSTMRSILAAVSGLRDVNDKALRLSLYRYGREATIQALYINRASASWVRRAGMIDIPVFPVTGKALLKEGFKAGPDVGRELKKREAAWIRRGLPD